MKKDKLKKVVKPSKVVKLSQNDIKKLQKERVREKRIGNTSGLKEKIENVRFTTKHLFVLLGIVLVIIAYYLFDNYHRLGLVFNKEITSQDVTVIDTMYTDNVVLAYQDKILVFQKGVLSAYGANGNEAWSKKLEEIYTPNICTSGKYIQVTNNDTGYIYVLEGQYEIARIKIEGDILSSKINSEGTSVVEYSTSGLKTVVGVYNKKGRELCLLKLVTNTISDYVLSDDSKVLAYSYADISGISLVTKVDVVELDRLNEDGYNFETIVTKNNELVYKMYWEGKKLNILLNDSIIKYNYANKKVEDYDVTSLNAVNMDICDNTLAYVSQNGINSSYSLDVVYYDLSLKSSTEITEPPKYYIYSDGLIFVCYQKQMDIYNKYGTKLKSYISDTVITKPVIYNDGKCVAMYISNKIITFKI